jgi:hypothetical protein
MKKCVECGKKLGILGGFIHPVKGNKFLLCSSCFDTIYESVIKWREAHLPYVDFFDKKTVKNNKNIEISKIPNNLFHSIKMVENFWTEKEI